MFSVHVLIAKKKSLCTNICLFSVRHEHVHLTRLSKHELYLLESAAQV